jgi:hypothetical protein
MIYAIINEDGAMTGFYDTRNGGLEVDSATFIPVSDAFKEALISDNKWRYTDGNWSKLPVTLSEQKLAKIALLKGLKITLKTFNVVRTAVDLTESTFSAWVDKQERLNTVLSLQITEASTGLFLNYLLTYTTINSCVVAIENYEAALNIWEYNKVNEINASTTEEELFSIDIEDGKPEIITLEI